MRNFEKRLSTLEAQQAQCGEVDDESILANTEGFDLSLVPGATFGEKVEAVISAHWGKSQLSPEARHAARGWFGALGKLFGTGGTL